MKRIFLAVLLVVVAVFLIPGLRSRAQPGIDRFQEVAGERLEGPISPVLNPYRRLRTRTEISRIMTELIKARNLGYRRPEPADLGPFILQRLDAEHERDYWGSPYIAVPRQDSLAVVSPGPDREYFTDDDIELEIRYGAPPRANRGRRR
jgi:hypothetical protein